MKIRRYDNIENHNIKHQIQGFPKRINKDIQANKCTNGSLKNTFYGMKINLQRTPRKCTENGLLPSMTRQHRYTVLLPRKRIERGE